MSRFKILYIFFLLFFILGFAEEKNNLEKNKAEYSQEKIKEIEEEYKLAVLMYKRGSYYSALNILSKIIKYRNQPYYNRALLLSAKIYLILGRKTGIKELLHKALYYINTYSYSARGPYNWEFYYIKGNIYENMFMYERALALYKMAFARAKTPKEQFETVIAILRTAAWQKRLDIVTRYIVLVNLEELSEKEKKEFEFVKGLVEFQKGNYQEAFKYLIPVYKEYEQYLIENPIYYLILGENAYRLGKYTFAKQIFRRIISIVKDEFVIRRALLRLGDIAHKEGDNISAFNYYYQVINKYKNTPEAKVAKLKLIYLSEIDPVIKKKIMRAEDPDLKDPFGFVFKTLVLNRNTYVGFFALGNFGSLVFSSGSEELFKKLTWELSLVNVNRMKYEHKEYINELWKEKIKKLPPTKICSLFLSNEEFFYQVFDRSILEFIYTGLKNCGKYKIALDVAKKILEKYKDDKGYILLADAYYTLKNYKKSLEILKKVTYKGCSYTLLFVKNNIFLGNIKTSYIKLLESRCKENPEKYILEGYIYLKNDQIVPVKEIINKIQKKIPILYKKSIIAKIFVRELIYKFFENNLYKDTLKILIPLSEMYKEDCDINSWTMIALIKSGRLDKINEYSERLEKCNTEWSIVAKNVYQDYLIIRSVKNE